MGVLDLLFRVESPENRIEGMIRQAGEDFWFSLDEVADDFIPVMKREAQKRGIDPLYLYYVFFEQHRRWHRLVGTNYRAMSLVLTVAQKWSNKYPDWGDYEIPPKDKQKDVDEALKAVARWAHTDWTASVVKLYAKALRGHYREAQSIYKAKYEESLSNQQLFCWLDGLMVDLAGHKNRMWPSYGQTLWGFINKLFRDEGLSCSL